MQNPRSSQRHAGLTRRRARAHPPAACCPPSVSFIVDWDAKFQYMCWRPVTAIRNGDLDGNDATERDAGWTSLNATPMHPEYPSQAIVASVSAGVVGNILTDHLAPDWHK